MRAVTSPPAIRGRLCLDSMPGRHEPFEMTRKAIAQRAIARVVCLARLEEVRSKSPAYAQAIEAGRLPWAEQVFPVPDYSIPEDREAALSLAQTIAQGLRSGERVLIHCGAGIGGTGTLAVPVLMALGRARADAYEAVSDVGSRPETSRQEELVQWVAEAL